MGGREGGVAICENLGFRNLRFLVFGDFIGGGGAG